MDALQLDLGDLLFNPDAERIVWGRRDRRGIGDFAVLMKLIETRAADTCKNEKYQELYTLSAKVSAAEQLLILNWDNIFAE